MTKEELEQEKKKNKEAIALAENNIEAMEQTVEIQNYLNELERRTKEAEKQTFLNSLTIGEDGTIFAPQRNYKYATLFLSEFINYAFTLKYYGKKCSEDPVSYMKLTFEEIIEYSNNTRKILRERKKYPDESPVENPYGFEIYPNPRENFECGESTFLRNCLFVSSYNLQEELENRGMTDVVVNDPLKTIIISDSIFSTFSPVDISALSMREQNAFFGEESQKILGVTLDDAMFTKPQDDGTIKKAPYTK